MPSSDLAAVLEAAELPTTLELDGASLTSLAERLDADRPAFLTFLKDVGLNIGQRQRLANAIGRASKKSTNAPVAALTSASSDERFASAADAIAAGQVALVTLTNTGYLAYTANCLASLERVGERVPLTVHCALLGLRSRCPTSTNLPTLTLPSTLPLTPCSSKLFDITSALYH